MNASLRELWTSVGARFEGGPAGDRLAGFGDSVREYQALTAACGLVDRSERGRIRIAGSDRVSFLHGMVTQDIERLGEGRAAPALLVTAKGKMVAQARAIRRTDDLWLDTDPACAAAAWALLEKHLISEDAELANESERWAMLSLIGPKAAEALQASLGIEAQTLEVGQASEHADSVVIASGLGSLRIFDLLVPAERAPEVAWGLLDRGASAGLIPAGDEAFEIARIEEGVPRFGAELDGEVIPLEAGLGAAISYDKGCYLGQEVIARATFRGQVRRALAGLVFADGAAPSPGEQLFAPGEADKPVGQIRSLAASPRLGLIGLGYLRRECLESGQPLVDAQGRQVSLRPISQ